MIASGSYGERKSWGDTETRRLEDCLNKFILGLLRAARGSKRARLEAERREREWEEERRRQLEAEERRIREEARIKEFDSMLAAWARCRAIRDFVDAVEERAAGMRIEITPESELFAWLSWARKRADAMDPLSRLPALAGK